MITITYATKSARCELELPHENVGPLGWVPDGSTIYVDPLQSERAYEAIPSPLYKPKGQK
jgi:hypothetical protein